MSYTVRRALATDADGIAELRRRAFVNDVCRHWLDFSASESFRSTWLKEFLAGNESTIVAVDASASLLGFMQYKVYGTEPVAVPNQQIPEWYESKADHSLPTIEGRRRQELFVDVVNAGRKNNMIDHERYIHVHYLAVDPGQQGRGLGKALLEVVQAKAAKDYTPAYLESSQAGLPFYQHLGWTLLPEAQHIKLEDPMGAVASVQVPTFVYNDTLRE